MEDTMVVLVEKFFACDSFVKPIQTIDAFEIRLSSVF